ncbi:MAG: hypothetical protein OEY01_03360 [Desulfobulbaceae bacterium]|nr:hypothetical protein [Desulfobulbaceae bacterium]
MTTRIQLTNAALQNIFGDHFAAVREAGRWESHGTVALQRVRGATWEVVGATAAVEAAVVADLREGVIKLGHLALKGVHGDYKITVSPRSLDGSGWLAVAKGEGRPLCRTGQTASMAVAAVQGEIRRAEHHRERKAS